MRGKLGALLVGAVALATGFVAIAGAGPAPTLPAPTVTPNVGPPGTTFTVSGTGCIPPANGTSLRTTGTSSPSSSAIDLTVHFVPTPVFQTVTAVGGAWSAQFTVPAGHQAGPVDVEAICRFSGGGTGGGAVAVAGYSGGRRALAFQSTNIPYPIVTFTVTAPVAAPDPAAAPAAVAAAPRTTG